jgi:hypothetical protein
LAARLEVKDAGPRVEPWVPAEELSYAPWPGPGDSEGYDKIALTGFLCSGK